MGGHFSMQEKKTNVPGEKQPEFPETGKQGGQGQGQGDVGKKGGDLGKDDTGKSGDIGKQYDKPVDKP
jgi:hypothetical protein